MLFLTTNHIHDTFSHTETCRCCDNFPLFLSGYWVSPAFAHALVRHWTCLCLLYRCTDEAHHYQSTRWARSARMGAIWQLRPCYLKRIQPPMPHSTLCLFTQHTIPSRRKRLMSCRAGTLLVNILAQYNSTNWTTYDIHECVAWATCRPSTRGLGSRNRAMTKRIAMWPGTLMASSSTTLLLLVREQRELAGVSIYIGGKGGGHAREGAREVVGDIEAGHR